MSAYRLTTVQVNQPLGGEATDSTTTNTVPFGADECDDQLDAEATMHAASGWRVRRTDRFVVAAKVRQQDMTLVVRVIYVVEFDPAADGGDVELKPVLS